MSQKERNEEAKPSLKKRVTVKTIHLTSTYFYNTSENHKKIAVALGSVMWKKTLGLKVTLENQEWKTYSF